MKIKLITCERGDWEVLIIDDKVEYEGHNIPNFVYHSALAKLGCPVVCEEITDEAMEEGDY